MTGKIELVETPAEYLEDACKAHAVSVAADKMSFLYGMSPEGPMILLGLAKDGVPLASYAFRPDEIPRIIEILNTLSQKVIEQVFV